MATIAVVFDFDDTLAPDTTTALLRDAGVDTDTFWRETVKSLVEEGYDPAVAWLDQVLKYARPGGPLEGLSDEVLAHRGRDLDDQFYEGLPEMFDDLRSRVAEVRDASVEFYIISGGLKELLQGSEVVNRNFEAVYASQLGASTDTGVYDRIKRVVTFTEKTRYLFEIHKGILPVDSQKNPFLVNQDVHPDARRIPFRNIVYVGDGLTDIPCFSLVQKAGGTAFGVFDPRREESAKRAFLEFMQPHRVTGMHSPDYRADADLGALLRMAVTTKAMEERLRPSQA
jgi:phosphoserine phosphatase